MKRLFGLLLFCLISSMLLGTVQAATFKTQDQITQSDPIDSDAFFSGQSIQVDSPIGGELIAAGTTVTIKTKPTRSAAVAGNKVSVENGSGYNIFAAGNDVTIGGVIENDVYIAGQTITIKPDTHVKGTLRVAGSSILLSGQIDGDVHAISEFMDSNASIGGTFNGQVARLTFAGGSIGKDLLYRSHNEARGLDSLEIEGKVERTPITLSPAPILQRWLYTILTVLVTGAAIVFLFPRKLTDISQTVRQSWLKSFLYGLATLLISPLGILVLFVSSIAWPLALIWAMVLGILIYFAVIAGQIAVGQLILQRINQSWQSWWGALFLGIALVSALRIIPIFGTIIFVAIMLVLVIPIMGATLISSRNSLTS